MRALLRVGLVLGLAACSTVIGAQQPACHMAGPSEDAIVPEKLPPPVKLTGIGNGSIAITSSSAEAKMWFEQGLNLLHDFWDYESARAFEQSVRVDPKCAMCWWGLAQAEGFREDNQAFRDAALKQAALLAKDKKNTTAAERLYIQAAQEAAKEKNGGSNKGPNTGAPNAAMP